jgi:diguanylate cyclase (GGDEF)-like protein
VTAFTDPLLRRRRTVEFAALVIRGGGMVSTVLYMTGLLNGLDGPTPPELRMFCLVALTLMAVANIFARINHRRPTGPQYRALSVAQVALDAVGVTGCVIWIQGFNGQTAWPTLMIPIVVAAVRHRLPGALVVWAFTSGAFALGMHVIENPAVRPGEVATAFVINLAIAALCGVQGTAFSRQLQELEQVRSALHHQATHDPLTGLPNRDCLEEYAREQDGRALSVLLIDLDGFKEVNDTLGHAAGDRLLQEVGRRLAGGLRAGDMAGRVGGDEFVVLLPGASAGGAAELAARLRTAIGKPVDLGGRPLRVGASIGVAARADGDPADLAALAVVADAAMYREKAISRG